MSDASDLSVPASAAPAAKPTSNVGTTAIAASSVTTVADIIDWVFQCWEKHSIVTPDQATAMGMAMGLILLAHMTRQMFKASAAPAPEVK
jgi:hypothetical protein